MAFNLASTNETVVDYDWKNSFHDPGFVITREQASEIKFYKIYHIIYNDCTHEQVGCQVGEKRERQHNAVFLINCEGMRGSAELPPKRRCVVMVILAEDRGLSQKGEIVVKIVKFQDGQ